MKNFYLKNGYVLVKNLFNKKKIQKVKKEIDNVFSLYLKKKKISDKDIIDLFKNDFNGFYGCAQACQNLISVCNIQTSNEIINVLKKLGVNFPNINTRPLLSISSKKTAINKNYWNVAAHQDWPSTQGSINGITCWIPLINLDKNIGPLMFAPKTHYLGYLEHEEKGVPILKKKFNFVNHNMEIGDALFFNFFTVHKSGLNKTKDKIRWTLHFRYNDLKEKSFIDRKFPRHRIDVRKKGILFPDFPSKLEFKKLFLG